ncbi:MAG: 2OG-Fe(II) oxygenase [Paracoccaceae bacterium]|nr:2OG-Fe(II) oxygenase [Paracoccaceae bacterium]
MTRPPIDFARYPLDQDTAAMGPIIAEARAQLDRDQYCSLPGFLTPEAVTEAAAEATGLMGQANPAESLRNCYLQRQGDPSMPADHPRNVLQPARYRMIAADLLPQTSHLKRLYFWEPFQHMVAAIVGAPKLYPNDDPLQPVNVICYGPGDQSAWHYDSTNAFTMTLMLQGAEAGGAFELAPNTRESPDGEDIPYMTEVLTGASDRVRTVSRAAGELTIFRGCNSLHRVSPVAGSRTRLMAVFVYEERPGVTGDPEVNQTVYGRTGTG